MKILTESGLGQTLANIIKSQSPIQKGSARQSKPQGQSVAVQLNMSIPGFPSVIRAFAFNQVVTFDSLGSEGTTTIDGGRITTGVIKNSTFSGDSNWDTYSSAGMGINLDNGAINAESFYITIHE